MAKLRITHRTFATKRFLEVKEREIVWFESAVFGTKQKISFGAVDAVLRGKNTLSIQVKRKLYSIPYKPDNADHRTVIARLVAECRRTTPRRPQTAAAPRMAPAPTTPPLPPLPIPQETP
jgi:hypothetical protein